MSKISAKKKDLINDVALRMDKSRAPLTQTKKSRAPLQNEKKKLEMEREGTRTVGIQKMRLLRRHPL